MNDADLQHQANVLAEQANLFDPRFGLHVSVLTGDNEYYAVIDRRKLLTLSGVGTTTLYKFAEFLRRMGWQVFSTI